MATRILAVDDEPQFERLISQRFRRKIKSGEYEFVFAANGVEALKMLSEDPSIDMLLTDINMPEMDGLSLITKVKEIRPLLKTVIVSAYGDMKNIRTAMNIGAFDFVTKPIDFPDLETTINKTLGEADIMRDAARARELAVNNERLKAIDQLKTHFFTNISHEFRTPLTVITGMAEQIGENPDEWLEKGVLMIRRNSNNLLDLVNQILDLRKLESGAMSLNLVKGNFISYLKYLLESFSSLANKREIKLQFETSISALQMDYDPEKILRIITNLLSNAIKFTPDGGQVEITAQQKSNTLHLVVSDTGIGISPEKLDHVFDRFFQADSFKAEPVQKGTGIGLALVKELVSLMEGEISIDSVLGEGTRINLHLPIQDDPSVPLINSVNTSPIPAIGDSVETIQVDQVDEDLPKVLIVEDNEDVSTYLRSCLEGLYAVLHASDGEEGVQLALNNIPDLIISDVMMPKKTGLELCDELKNDDRTSHIPIVLLTAKADLGSKLDGLKKGADAYLAKPFNKEELLVRLEKLLELRKALQSRYQSAFDITPSTEPATQQEDQFIINIREAVEENLDDENFGIPELCRAVGMSRTQLHRKLKALTGTSTSHFVRGIRLHKAKQLLTSTDLNISQIAYEVGFKDPKYFSRTFSEEFGVSPNQWKS